MKQAAEPSYKWKLLVSVIFGIFMSTLDTTAVNVAFPTLRAEYAVSLYQAQWIVSVYVLSLGMATPVAGFLGDRYGTKRIYVLGLVTFVVGSLAAGVAPSLGSLIVARALQGIGGGIAMPCATAMLFREFPRSRLGLALGLFGVALLFAPALGPVLAGWFIDQHHWRWIFFVNVPIGLLGIGLAARWLSEQRVEHAPTIDRWTAASVIAAVMGFGLLLYGVSVVSVFGWASARVVSALGVSVASLGALVIIELRGTSPLLDIRLFRQRTFLVATLVGYVTVVAFFGAEFLLPLYLQVLRHRSALDAGLALLPLALGAGLTMPVAGILYDRMGPRPLIVVGFTLLLYNTWTLAHLTATTSYRVILGQMALRGFALGLAVQTPFTAALASVAHNVTARASSLVISTRLAVQAIGVAILATLAASTVQSGEHGVSLQGISRAYTLTFVLSAIALALGFLLPGRLGPHRSNEPGLAQ
jgi:EmrB/QacA subfamily drug resistance transporter